MRVLYYSVHQILEWDEVRLLQGLGHDVCCLGACGPDGAIETFRDAITFSEAERALYAAFEATGGVFAYGTFPTEHCIPAAFVDLFDVVIVMNHPVFIEAHWAALSRRPVVWRTIGQGIDVYEAWMQPFRGYGLRILRYAATEALAANYLGADAMIRFHKSPATYAGWTGETPQVLTFAHNYRERYPADAADFLRIVEALPVVVGGAHNEGLPGAIGQTTWPEQVALYRRSRVYLYGHGLEIPYTLNFIEAWMTGIPVVVHAPLDRRGRYFEIDQLITEGIDGYVCRDVETARARLEALVTDHALALRIGSEGRKSAMRLFASEQARSQWRTFLTTIPSNQANTRHWWDRFKDVLRQSLPSGKNPGTDESQS